MKPSDTNFGNAILACARLVGIRLDPVELHDLNSKYELKSSHGAISFPMMREKTDAILNTIGLSNHEWHSNADEALLPFLAFSSERGWVVVHGRNSLNDWMITEFGKKSIGEHSLISSLSGMPILKINADTRLGEMSSIRSVVKKIMREHKGNLFDATVASIFINLLALVTSTFSMQVYDRVIPTQGLQTLVVLSVGVLLSIVFDMIIKATKTKLLEEVIVDWDSQLSSVVFRRLLSVRVDHLPRIIGTLSAQLRGYETIRIFLTSAPMFLFVDLPFAFLFVFVIGFIGGIYMALVPIAFLIVSVVTGLIFKRKIENNSQKGTLASNQKTGILVEAVEGAETIKAMGGGSRMLMRWQAVSKLASIHEFENKRTNDWVGFVAGTSQQLSYVLLIIVGALLAVQGTLTMGALIACSIISGRVLAPTGMIPGMLMQWANAKAALKGLEAIWALPTDTGPNERPLMPENLKGKYIIDNVSFSYPGTLPILNIKKLEIKPGEKIGVIGPVGTGKSTLLRILSGLYAPSTGRVFLDDLDMNQISRSVLSERIGFLQQEVTLFSGTLRENLIIGMADPGDDAILKAAEKTGLFEMIASHPLGMWLPITEGGEGLSGGQRQLVGITRLYLRQPSIWLLDEPTASIDERLENKCIDILRSSVKPEHTLIVVTHKPVLLSLFTRLIVIGEQGIVADGPKNDVLRVLKKLSDVGTVQ